MTSGDEFAARANLIEAGRRAGAQSSRVATRADAIDRTSTGYIAWRTELILQHRIGVDELIDHWIEWKKDRDQYVFLVELGFDDPARIELQSNLEAMVQLAEADLKRLTRTEVTT